MNRSGFPVGRPVSTVAGFHEASILILVAIVVGLAPRCEAGSENRPVSEVGYTVFATGLAGPRGLLFAPSGDLFVAEQSGGAVARITPDGRVSRIANWRILRRSGAESINP